MASLRPAESGRATLFERLVDLEPGQREAEPFILHDREGVRKSVALALERLLSTRAPVAADVLEKRERTTIDYGIPDHSLTSPQDGAARDRLARHIADAIRAFEPRLTDPVVTVRLSDARSDALVAEISGHLTIGMAVSPALFAIPVGGAGSPDAGMRAPSENGDG